MPDVHYPDTLVESYREKSGSLAATVARMRQENRELAKRIEAQGDLIQGLGQKLLGRDRLIARLRAGGKG